MTVLRNYFPALMVLFFIVSACTKDELTELSVNPDDPNTTLEIGFHDESDIDDLFATCFTIVYPIELNFSDSTQAVVANDQELATALTNWYDVQGEDAESPIPTYPVTIILQEDGSEKRFKPTRN